MCECFKNVCRPTYVLLYLMYIISFTYAVYAANCWCDKVLFTIIKNIFFNDSYVLYNELLTNLGTPILMETTCWYSIGVYLQNERQ